MTEAHAPADNWRRLARWVAMGFGAGALPRAPGTFGTVVGVAAYLVLMPLTPVAYVSVVCAMFFGGIWLCAVARRGMGDSDPPGIVWDEIVGYLVTMFLAPRGWVWVGLGFVLFRVFDIWKPFPIRQLDRRVGGGLGIMVDDVVAGVYAWLVLRLLAYSGLGA
jgi:phosphatidylglycerophosphatase A